MKKMYNEPEMTVTKFEYEDIMNASNLTPGSGTDIPSEEEDLG